METNSINRIKTLRDKIVNDIELYRAFCKENNYDMKLSQFGQEGEYSLNGLIGGVKNILTDISYLTKAHDLFIKCSTFSERSVIEANLTNLSSYITRYQHQDIATTIDKLKIILRLYNLKHDKDRFLEFNNEIDNLRKKAMLLEDDLKDIKGKITESEDLHNKIIASKTEFDTSLDEINEQKEELINEIEELTTKHKSFEALVEKATNNDKTIESKLDLVIENEETFNNFMNQIEEREKQLINQKNKTDNYEKELANYGTEQARILKEAQDLIDKSLQSLQYSTTEGISTAFLTQYGIANKRIYRVSWLIGAGFFIVVTLLIGIWILTAWGINENMDPVMSIIGRLSMVPFTLLAALFCANQYIKQKNIIEDYAYKTVLSKSMIAFSEELRAKDPSRYAEYLSTVLKEIHQDPLRKRSKEKDEVSLKDTAGLFDKILELLKLTTKT